MDQCNECNALAVGRVSITEGVEINLCAEHLRDFVDSILEREEAPEGRAPE